MTRGVGEGGEERGREAGLLQERGRGKACVAGAHKSGFGLGTAAWEKHSLVQPALPAALGLSPHPRQKIAEGTRKRGHSHGLPWEGTAQASRVLWTLPTPT